MAVENKEIVIYPKDIQIMKQSQSKLVVEYTRDLGVILTVAEMLHVTDLFVETCLRPLDAELKKRVKDLDVWLGEKVKKQNGE